MAHSTHAHTSAARLRAAPAAGSFVRTPGTAFGLALLLLVLLLLPLVFSTATLGAFEFPKFLVLLLAAIPLGALGLCALIRPRQRGPQGEGTPRPLWRKPLLIAALLLLASAVASTVFSISPLTSVLGTHESHAGLCTILGYAALFFAARGLCRNLADARLLLGACVVASAVAAVYALLQAVGLDPIDWQGLSSVGGYLRPFGTLGHPNFLAAYLVMTFPITGYFLARALRERRRGAAVVLGLVGGASCLAVVLSVSRAAWLALACVVLVLLIGAACSRRWRLAAAAGLMPVGAVALLGGLLAWGGDHPLLGALRQRLERLDEHVSRQHIWDAGLAIFRDHPLLGCGLDTFQLAFSGKRTAAYWQVEWDLTPARAHNEAIHILATQGVVGAAALLALLAGLALAAVRAWRRTPVETRPLVLAVLAALAGFAVQNLFGFTVIACGALFAVLAGLLARLGEEEVEPASEVSLGHCRWALAALACGGMVAILVLGLNFLGPQRDPVTGMVAGGLLLAALLGAGWGVLHSAAASAGRKPALPRSAPAAVPLSTWGLWWRRGGRGVIWVTAVALVLFAVVRPYAANVLCRRGETLAQTNVRPAVEALFRAAMLDPIQDLCWAKLGGAAQVAGRKSLQPKERVGLYRLARVALVRATVLNPLNAYHHGNLGQLLAVLARERLADPRDAYAAFDRALQLDGQNVHFWTDAATAALGVQDLAKARSYAERGTALYPKFAPTRAQLGYVALKERRYVEAVNLLCEALHGEWHDHGQARVAALANLASAYMNLRLYDAAADAGRQALELAPHVPQLHYNHARALEMAGRPEEALAGYRAVLERAPDHREAREGLERVGGTAALRP
jgi:O-antigen ligase/tetratricopeptide (TPR) repeat protein